MKKVLAVTALIAFTGLVVVQPVLAGRGAGRHFKQEKRICQGIESGELTRGETRQLVKQQQIQVYYLHIKKKKEEHGALGLWMISMVMDGEK